MRCNIDAGAVNKLEMEEGEGAKHEADVELRDEKHTEAQSNLATRKIVEELEEETNDDRKKLSKVCDFRETKAIVHCRCLCSGRRSGPDDYD